MLRPSAFFAALCSLAAVAAQADETLLSADTIESVRIGFAGRYKLGCWTPVVVSTGDRRIADGRMEIEAPDSDSVPVRFVGPREPTVVDGGYLAYARMGRPEGPIRLLFQRDPAGGAPPEILRTLSDDDLPTALPATNELLLEMGASIGMGAYFRRFEEDEAERSTAVTLDAQQALPDRWYGYEGVDAIVIVAKPAIEKLGLNVSEIDAIEKWVRLGGTLCLICGEGGERLIAPGTPFARLLPAEFESTVDLRRFNAIEMFAGAEERLDARMPRLTLRVPQLRNVRGQIELFDGTRPTDLPLVVRAPLGFGQIVFIGLDLHEEVFLHWSAAVKLLEKVILKRPGRAARAAQEPVRQNRRLGFVDLAGQLRGALDQFEGVTLIPFWAVSLLAIVYIGLLFPLSYLLITRWLDRPLLAWILAPGLIALFCAAAYLIAARAKGDRLRINQLNLVDVDLADRTVRGVTWFNVFSPDNSLYDLRVDPRFAGMETSHPPESLLAWYGLPGSGLGGMNSMAAPAPLFDNPYTIDPQAGSIVGVPVAVWSSKSFIARWEGVGGGIEADLSANLDRRLRGTITNRLSVPLESPLVLFGDLIYPLDRIEPGQSVSFDRREPESTINYLTRRRLSMGRYEAPPYDRTGFELERIVEVMMFHDAAGGPNYTGLLNRHHRFMDFTHLLEAGRAVLVAQGPDGATVQLDGRPAGADVVGRRTMIYRYLLDVR